MKDISKIDLKKATVFDLSDDVKEIAAAIGRSSIDKNEYLKGLSDTGRILDMVIFAENTSENALLLKLKKTFKSELQSVFIE